MFYKICLCGLAAGLFAPAVNGAILIDDFEAFQTTTASEAVPSDANALLTAGAIGGERELEVMWNEGSNEVDAIANAGASGILNYNTGAGTFGQANVTWDGVNGTGVFDPTGLGGIDLTDGGAALGIVINVDFDDLPVQLGFRAWTDAGNWSFANLTLPGGIFTNQLFFIPFGNFVVGAGAGVDFENLGALALSLQSDFPSVDLQIEFIESNIPTPGTFMLAGAGGLLVLRRKR